MKVSDKCINLIKKYEGCRLTAYKPIPTEKYWTIGYGRCNASIKQGMTITQEQADEFLKQDLAKFEKLVMKYDGIYHWTQCEYDSLVCFCYNIGSIDGLVEKGKRLKNDIPNKMLEYNKVKNAKGQKVVLAGLTKRRKDEQALFLSSMGVQSPTTSTEYPILKLGCKGSDVGKLQIKLSTIGYSLTVDNDFGNNTKNAVISLQKDASLVADGIVGEKTWKSLDEIKVYSLRTDGNKSLSTNFKVKEFACQDNSDTVVLHTEFIADKLQKIRTHFNKPVTINSAYRTPTHNRKVGGSSNSYHVKGRAFDIVVKGVTPNEVAKYAQSIGIKGIIRYSWGVHVDSRATKYWAVDNNGRKTSVSGF